MRNMFVSFMAVLAVVIGQGFAPAVANPVQAQMLARRAAFVDAQRQAKNDGEVIKTIIEEVFDGHYRIKARGVMH